MRRVSVDPSDRDWRTCRRGVSSGAHIDAPSAIADAFRLSPPPCSRPRPRHRRRPRHFTYKYYSSTTPQALLLHRHRRLTSNPPPHPFRRLKPHSPICPDPPSDHLQRSLLLHEPHLLPPLRRWAFMLPHRSFAGSLFRMDRRPELASDGREHLHERDGGLCACVDGDRRDGQVA